MLGESTQQLLPGVALESEELLVGADHVAAGELHPGQLALEEEDEGVEEALEVVPAAQRQPRVGRPTAEPQRPVELVPHLLGHVLAVAHVGHAQLEVRQVDPVPVLPPADDEVAGLDVPVDHLVAVQVLDAVEQLQRGHEGGLEREPSPATQPQGLQVIAQLLNRQVDPSALLEGLLDLREAVQVWLFQFLVGLDLILHEPALAVGVALEEEHRPVRALALLHHLVPAVLHHLHHFVLPLYHYIHHHQPMDAPIDSAAPHTDTRTAKIYLLMGRFASGKTTLIRRILGSQTDHRYAIIQNEFAEGEMGIEQPLIMDETGTPFSSFLELPNGCICCSAKNDLVAAVEYIVNNTPVRNIIVETNGLADPAASIKQFWFDEQMNINAELHAVITMVSARKWEQGEGGLQETFVKQCVFASQILVSFVDLAGEEKYREIEQELRGINCECSIARSDQVDLYKLLHGDSLFDKEILRTLKDAHLHHGHSGVRPLFLRGKCSLAGKAEVEQRVGELLWERGLKILRIKGVFSLQESDFVLELQGVEDLFEVRHTKTPSSLYAHESRVLVIGEQLHSAEIGALLGITE